ncbi:hypothetical protein C900_00627 [Fulvivirga imtechensis AK7]|uniref:Uncharacterized protein n=1 Tax=Fulvivirga imtechensis AK7 TaxID=1237149 RepID=L8JLE1_9BACT|nr:hypothetical protein C900_00627 [Fulvivirga imtechensis AK7]
MIFVNSALHPAIVRYLRLKLYTPMADSAEQVLQPVMGEV